MIEEEYGFNLHNDIIEKKIIPTVITSKQNADQDFSAYLFEDNYDVSNIYSMEKIIRSTNIVDESAATENIPEKITGTYIEDYNISFVDNIIKKKLKQESLGLLKDLKVKKDKILIKLKQPHRRIDYESYIKDLEIINTKIEAIESGTKYKEYVEKANQLISDYHRYQNSTKTVFFDMDQTAEYIELDEEGKKRIKSIDNYLNFAKNYINIDIVRYNNYPTNVCLNCGTSLEDNVVLDTGCHYCPNPECNVEYYPVVHTKMPKDNTRITPNYIVEDDSIENFKKAFDRYQGCQSRSHINIDELIEDLDIYFIQLGRQTGDEIKLLPLNNRGRRGDTDPKMLWTALEGIGKTKLLEDTNLIGHLYWGWKLPDVGRYKETVFNQYIKTQASYYKIPLEEKTRTSSLGTQYRLWRQLELAGYECYRDEFKIAENDESLLTHDNLWRLMCKGCNDSSIRYIE